MHQTLQEKLGYRTQWIVRKYRTDDDYLQGNEPYETVGLDGNLLLNEGIGELWDLACGLGTPAAFSNANAYLGVGDSNTAASATQTGLQASTNKLYQPMESGYPQRSGETVTFRAVFTNAEANWAWEECTVANGNSDASVNLNRKVGSLGTKASGTWTLDLAITLS